MAISYKVSRRLKVALAKASSAPEEEQDEIAAMIMAKLSGDDFTARGTPSSFSSHASTVRDFIDGVLPKHAAARSLCLLFLSFTLFVQAPMAMICGLAMAIQQVTATPSGAARYSRVNVGDASHTIMQVPGATPPGGAADPPP